MEPGFRSTLVDLFRRGEAARDVRLLAAQGVLAPRADEQLALLILLVDDADPEIASTATATLEALPGDSLKAFLAQPAIPAEMREFFASRGVTPDDRTPAAGAADPAVVGAAADDAASTDDEAGEHEGNEDEDEDEDEDEEKSGQILSSLSIVQRMKLAMKGTRAQRAQLIRDSNKLVAAAVLGSPKLTETEVEAFAKMANVTEEVLRAIAMNRTWVKNYGVIAGLTRNPKTPPGISMQMVQRLNERDLKMLSTDRNVPEAVRLAAKKFLRKGPKDMA
jgi:hypothetical protein